MGNNNSGAIDRLDKHKGQKMNFLQSQYDFPLTISLGDKAPSWGLNRWRGDCGLRFIPADDEGYKIRGDRRRLVYKGLRHSHRFTILGDSAFEYDCILEREPDSHVISLRLEGAEDFDFLRQPDFIKNPFLAGSYAIYKKDTFVGEGTGKLCHIHRPEIIDARGQRCWGDLAIGGNELQITIPEWFLSEAVYPVVVDPTIGTATVGSQYLYQDEDKNEPLQSLGFEVSIVLNRFFVPEVINGDCVAFFYTNEDDGEAAARPVFYTDNNNIPLARNSRNESLIDFRVYGSNPKGWRHGSFETNGSIPSGTYIWFGAFTEYMWYPRFDYGVNSHVDWWDDYDSIPEVYPLKNNYYFRNLKLSMYFSYSSALNYVKTIIQGVTLTDNRKTIARYKRYAVQTVKDSISIGWLRKIRCSMLELIEAHDKKRHLAVYMRELLGKAVGKDETAHGGEYHRLQIEAIQVYGFVFRGLLIFVKLLSTALLRDFLLRRFLKSNEELILKSGICREIILDSSIH